MNQVNGFRVDDFNYGICQVVNENAFISKLQLK